MSRFERLSPEHDLQSFTSGNDARGFYEHFGFRSLPRNDDRLVMKASTAATSLSIDWP